MQISKREQFVKTYRARMVLAFLFCTIFAFLLLGDIVRVKLDNAESSFEDETAAVFSQLQSRLNSTGAVISALSGWHHSQMGAKSSELSVFTKEMLENNPHIYSIQYLQSVSPKGRRAYERSMRRKGYATFKISEKNEMGELVKASKRSFFFPVTSIEPVEPETMALLGYDIGSDEILSNSIFEAVQTGELVVSKPTRLLNDDPVFFVFKAVYKGKILPKEMVNRLTQVDGIFAAVVVGEKLKSFLFDEFSADNMNVLLHHNGFNSQDANGHIFKYTAERSGKHELWQLMPAFRISYSLEGVQLPLDVVFEKRIGSEDIRFFMPLGVIIIYFLVLLLIRRFLKNDLKHDIENEMAQEALYREKEKAEITLHSIADGVITVDMDNRIEYMNKVAEWLTGWKSREAYGKTLNQVFVTINADTDEIEKQAFNDEWFDKRTNGVSEDQWLRSSDGKKYVIKCSVAKIRSRSGDMVGKVIVFRDYTKEQELAMTMAHQAKHDQLTGLFNRREFESQLFISLEKSKREERQDVLCYIDLDQFKVVNDTCGHIAGDELLRQLTHILHANVRDSDVLARLGGDEFGLIIKGCSLNKAQEITSVLLNAIRDFRFVWEGKRFDIGASMGLVMIHEDIGSIHEVMSAADSACYMAKDKGRNRIFCHSQDDHELLNRQGEMQWVHQIHDAFENRRFRLFRQKVVSLRGEKTPDHYEILIRMRDENDEYVPPMAFIPAAERYNIMPEVDRWVVREALAQISREMDKSSIYNLNLSGKSLSEEGFLEFMLEQIKLSGISPERICFEITETAAISNLGSASSFIRVMRKKGCSFALDDFGSGLSSFGYLKSLPVDYLKIDGTFVRDMMEDPVDLAMVTCIAQVGIVMGIKTIAEYVETDEIRDKLKEIGVDYAQGYAVSEPEEWLHPAMSEFSSSTITRWGNRFLADSGT